jgi:hypothetical protein
VIGAEFTGDDVPAGGAAETAGTDPLTTLARIVTIVVAGTSPSAHVTPPPATSTVVIKPRALRLKKSAMKNLRCKCRSFFIMHIVFFSTCLMI